MNPLIHRTDFGAFVMVNDTHLSRWVERDGRLDHARDYIARFGKYIPLGGTVIDCGTSIGDHTVTYASLVGPEGRVLGFEANPDVAECCALNLAIYPWAKIYNVALSDGERGVAGVSVDKNVGASYVTRGTGDNVVHTKLAPLDDYLGEINRCDFIKVDIEGFEPKMLDGAKDLITLHKPVILMEVNQGALVTQGFSSDDIYERLKKLGYRWEVADGIFGSDQYDILARM